MDNPFNTLDKRLSNIENILHDIKHKSKEDISKKTDEDRLLSRDDTAKLLMIDLSTLYHWTNKGKVTAYGIGARRYYKRSEIMLALTKVKTKNGDVT
jgi:hypothetical protein